MTKGLDDDELVMLRARVQVLQESGKVLVEANTRHFESARQWCKRAEDLRQAIIDTLVEQGCDTLPEDVKLTFDETSSALDLPESNGDGVPKELQPTPPEPGYVSQLLRVTEREGLHGWFEVRWGSGCDDHRYYEDLDAAAERYRKCILAEIGQEP